MSLYLGGSLTPRQAEAMRSARHSITRDTKTWNSREGSITGNKWQPVAKSETRNPEIVFTHLERQPGLQTSSKDRVRPTQSHRLETPEETRQCFGAHTSDSEFAKRNRCYPLRVTTMLLKKAAGISAEAQRQLMLEIDKERRIK